METLPPATRRLLAVASALIAIGALVCGAWAAAQFRVATHTRPWFVAPSGLVVTEDGTVFVGVSESEVHAYGPDGTPLRGWLLDEPGAFRLRRAGEQLEVVYAEGGRVEVFDLDGTRLEVREEPGAFDRLGAESEHAATAGATRYAIDRRGVVRVSPAPEKIVVPAPRAPLAWFGTRPLLPITGLILMAPIGLFACLAFSRRTPADRLGGAAAR